MPGSVNLSEASGAPSFDPGVDFRMCLFGCTSATAVAAGRVSALYNSPSALASDCGIGDCVDAGTQAITKTNGNPQPPAIAIYRTPDTTPGVMGSVTQTGVTGTAVMSAHSGAAPRGTYQVMGRNVTGGTIGVAGIVNEYSLDNGRTWLPTTALGTATTQKVYIPGSTPIDTGVQFDFAPASADLTALDTLLNEIKSDFNAHVILVGGSPVHGSTGLVDVVATADASSAGTRLALANALRLAYIAHIARVSGSPQIHITADVTAADQLAYGAAVDESTVLLLALDLKAKYNLHIANTSYHTNADATNATTAAAPSMGVLVAGDYWTCPTTPPVWAVADLYTAGDPATGAFAAVGQAATPFGMIVITEPAAHSDLTGIIAGLDYLLNTYNQKPWCIIRFRDPTAGESDATYVAAFQTFRASINDNRITCVAGSGWLTDVFRGYRYLRSGLPAVLARIQSFVGLPNERLAHHPGFGGDGPLENFTVVDDAGFLIGHDEKTRGGIDGPIAGMGGGLTFYLERAEGVAGTYVSECPVMYGALSTVLTGMDRRVVSAIERRLYAVGFTELQGAVLYDTVGSVNTLRSDVQEAIGSKLAKAIKDEFQAEFQNADDPNLVAVSPICTVSGAQVTVNVTVNDKLFGYLHTLNIVLQNSR